MDRLLAVSIAAAALALGCKDEAPPVTGSLLVHVSVNAAARVLEDTDGFYVALDLGTPQHVAVVDSILFDTVAIGPHRVDLTDVRSTCTVNPPSPDTVLVAPDTLVRTWFFGSCQ